MTNPRIFFIDSSTGRARPASTSSLSRDPDTPRDFRPYPNAPTRTRRSPARPTTPPPTPSSKAPASASASSPRANRTVATAPLPMTVWILADTTSTVDPLAAWPRAIVTRIVTAFSDPHAHVVLLSWPDQEQPTSGDDGGPVVAVDEAAPTVADLNRIASVVHPGRPGAVADPATTSTHEAPAPIPGAADLVITSVPSRPGLARHADAAALAAARLLRCGGIFAVITHCDWNGGELLDPTGAMVDAAQNADLLYLQHIVAAHQPIGPDGATPADDQPDHGDGVPAGVAHRRTHSDVLAFAQPREQFGSGHRLDETEVEW